MKIFLPLLLMLGIFALAISGCSTSEKSSEGMKVEQAPPSLSPGTASVEANVVSVTETDNGTLYKLMINKVNGYGSSTPSLLENKEIETTISKSIGNDAKLTVGEKYNLLLRSAAPLGEDIKNLNWQISKIN